MTQQGNDFLALVKAELARARHLHAPLHSPHEAYGAILEELDEFWDQVRMHDDRREKETMLRELVQVAAMAMRTAEDLHLL